MFDICIKLLFEFDKNVSLPAAKPFGCGHLLPDSIKHSVTYIIHSANVLPDDEWAYQECSRDRNFRDRELAKT